METFKPQEHSLVNSHKIEFQIEILKRPSSNTEENKKNTTRTKPLIKIYIAY